MCNVTKARSFALGIIVFSHTVMSVSYRFNGESDNVVLELLICDRTGYTRTVDSMDKVLWSEKLLWLEERYKKSRAAQSSVDTVCTD